jgi:hypothetical protein
MHLLDIFSRVLAISVCSLSRLVLVVTRDSWIPFLRKNIYSLKCLQIVYLKSTHINRFFGHIMTQNHKTTHYLVVTPPRWRFFLDLSPIGKPRGNVLYFAKPRISQLFYSWRALSVKVHTKILKFLEFPISLIYRFRI